MRSKNMGDKEAQQKAGLQGIFIARSTLRVAGTHAFRLKLPASLKVQDVFHVSSRTERALERGNWDCAR